MDDVKERYTGEPIFILNLNLVSFVFNFLYDKLYLLH